MEIQTQEARIILAIEAVRSSKKLNCCFTAKIYKILYIIFSDRITGRTYYFETKPNCYKLNDLEEETLVRYILDLDTRGFASRLASIEDITNYILESQVGKHVGKF
jgi:hypothetical protein